MDFYNFVLILQHNSFFLVAHLAEAGAAAHQNGNVARESIHSSVCELLYHIWFAGSHYMARRFSIWVAMIVNCDWVRRCILHFRAFDLYLILFVIAFLSHRRTFGFFLLFPFDYFQFYLTELFCFNYCWSSSLVALILNACRFSLFFLSLFTRALITQVCNAVYVRLNYTQPLCACPSR